MKKIVALIFLGIMLVNCTSSTNTKNSNQDSHDLDISLGLVLKDDIAFDILYNTIQVSSLHEKTPNYYKTQLSYKGINEKDSFIISTWNTDYGKFYFDMYKRKYLTKDLFLKKGIDSLVEMKKPTQRQLITAIKFTKNKQILIVDENNNQDFSDDRKIYFDKNFRRESNDSLVLNNLPILNFDYWFYKNNKRTTYNRKIIVYPSLNDYRFSHTKNEISKKSRLIVRFKDYWSGSFNVQNKKYNIAIQGVDNSYLTVLIKPDSLRFSKLSDTYNDRFKYRIKDTISLEGKIYILDSISDDLSKLKLKFLSEKKSFYGHRVGQKIQNQEFENLVGQKVNLNSLSKSKEYTLIDFWGTWCKPCIKALPELKKLYTKHSQKINLVSIAYDSDIEKVKAFTKANQMNWEHSFFDRTRIKGIVRTLKIKEYPTLILLDKNQQIIYRSSEDNGLKEIEKILSRRIDTNSECL